MAKSFDQILAESGKQNLLDKLRGIPGGYEKALNLFNKSGDATLAASSILGGGNGSDSQLLSQGKQSMINEIANKIIELDRQLADIPGVSITDAQSEAFLQKAIEQTKPYYDKKVAEIEAGISEGKIRTAEDLLIEMRKTAQEAENELKSLDITQAQTEEEFINTLANITATEGEDLELNRLNWIKQLGEAQKGQVQAGTLTSGVGQKDINNLQQQQDIQRNRIGRIADSNVTSAQIGQKYDLEKIKLAREKAQQERERFLGTNGQESELTQKLKSQAGISGDLGSDTSILAARSERGINPVYNTGALTDIQEESKRAIESRRQTLENEQRIKAEQEAENRRKIIENQKQQQQSLLNTYR